MALFPSLSHSQNSFEKRYLSLVIQPPINSRMNQRSPFALKEMATEHFGLRVAGMESREWTSAERLRPFARLGLSKFSSNRNDFRVYASCSRLASSAFTLGTAFVLPFYTLMVLAPKAELTKKLMKSTMPYTFLGVMYAYLLSLSWTPATLRSMFASKYLLPELPGMVKLFSNEMTLASAWIHLLAIDLFAARQVYWDGLENEVETRHSVSLCLLFCPIGILSHIITTSLTKTLKKIN